MKTTGLICMGNWDTVMDTRVFENPDIQIYGFKVYWNRMNPVKDVYNWDILNQNLINCTKANKKFVIELACGSFTPDYVYNTPYNVPKLTFKEFKTASIPQAPLKEFNVPLFTHPKYKEAFKTFLIAFVENIKSLKVNTWRDVMKSFYKISVSGINETTSEYRINSQTNLKADGVVSTDANKIWKDAGITGGAVVDTLKEFYFLIDSICQWQEKSVYLLGKGFPTLDATSIEAKVVDWAKDTLVDNLSFCFTSITVNSNGGSLFAYIRSKGLPIGGELNQKLYETCDSETLDAVLNTALDGGFSFVQIRDDNVLNSPEIITKYKNAFK